MRALLSILFLVLPLSGCSLLWPDGGDHDLRFDGTVTFVTIEGGAWVIEADDGTVYEPINLEEEYEEEGLRVRVWADRRDDLGSYLMVGPIIEIERIRVLGDPAERIHLLDDDATVEDLVSDPATVTGVELRGSKLVLEVRYSGGCEEHDFTLYGLRSFVETEPPGAEVYLVHDANGDACEAALTEVLTFEIQAMEERYDQLYPGGDGFLVNVHEPTDEGEFQHVAPDSPFYQP